MVAVVSILLAAASLTQSPVPKASVKAENSQFVFTGADVAFKLDDAGASTTVLQLKEQVDKIGNDLAAMLDDLTASDEELVASIAGLRKDTDQLLIDVNQGMADYKELSDERADDLKESFEAGIAAIKNTHEGGIAQMMVEYTNQMVQAEKDMDLVTNTWDTGSKALQGRLETKLVNMQKDYVAKVAGVTSKSAVVAKKAADNEKALAGKHPSQQILWIGGMRGWMYSGWRTMEFNRVELDAKGSHFEVHKTYFKIKKAGIYRINYWGIQYGNSGGARHMIRINGNNMMNEGHMEKGERTNNGRNWWRGYWNDMHIDQTWLFKENERIEIRMYISNHYSLHGSSNRNCYNRVTLHFLGTTSERLRV
jgi:hypothetical protein